MSSAEMSRGKSNELPKNATVPSLSNIRLYDSTELMARVASSSRCLSRTLFPAAYFVEVMGVEPAARVFDVSCRPRVRSNG